jgi:hypothetical protein
MNLKAGPYFESKTSDMRPDQLPQGKVIGTFASDPARFCLVPPQPSRRIIPESQNSMDAPFGASGEQSHVLCWRADGHSGRGFDRLGDPPLAPIEKVREVRVHERRVVGRRQ